MIKNYYTKDKRISHKNIRILRFQNLFQEGGRPNCLRRISKCYYLTIKRKTVLYLDGHRVIDTYNILFEIGKLKKLKIHWLQHEENIRKLMLTNY